MNGNRSDYGLQTPGPDVLHDRVWGLGGTGTLIYNRNAGNQFRFVTSARSDDYQIPNDPDAQAAGVRDVERERDGLASFSSRSRRSTTTTALTTMASTIHSAQPNTADHTRRRAVALTAKLCRYNATAGICIRLAGRRVCKSRQARQKVYLDCRAQGRVTTGHQALFLEDNTGRRRADLDCGRLTAHFSGASRKTPQVRDWADRSDPHLHWVLRGFWGHTIRPALHRNGSTARLRGIEDSISSRCVEIGRRASVRPPFTRLELRLEQLSSAREKLLRSQCQGLDVFFPLTIDGLASTDGRLVFVRPGCFTGRCFGLCERACRAVGRWWRID